MICTIISTGNEFDPVCKNEYEPPYPELKSRLRSKIWELYCRGYNEFQVNCEYGIPLWAAEIVTALKIYNDITLSIAMPYEEQTTNWTEEHRERFFDLHAQADNIRMISTHFTDDCYDRTDKYMIENSDLLLIAGDVSFENYSIALAAKNNIPTEFMPVSLPSET